MEVATQRALERAGHQTLLFDDRKSARFVGRALTQLRVLRAARRFRPDFIFLSKCLRLDLDTVQALIAGRPNALWYHDVSVMVLKEGKWLCEDVRTYVAGAVPTAKKEPAPPAEKEPAPPEKTEPTPPAEK